jgi:pilus assembly protein TadC
MPVAVNDFSWATFNVYLLTFMRINDKNTRIKFAEKELRQFRGEPKMIFVRVIPLFGFQALKTANSIYPFISLSVPFGRTAIRLLVLNRVVCFMRCL